MTVEKKRNYSQNFNTREKSICLMSLLNTYWLLGNLPKDIQRKVLMQETSRKGKDGGKKGNIQMNNCYVINKVLRRFKKKSRENFRVKLAFQLGLKDWEGF